MKKLLLVSFAGTLLVSLSAIAQSTKPDATASPSAEKQAFQKKQRRPPKEPRR